MDLTKVDNIELDGVNTKDYPDFSDAFILNADYDGKEMTEHQLEELNDNGDFVHEQVLNYFY